MILQYGFQARGHIIDAPQSIVVIIYVILLLYRFLFSSFYDSPVIYMVPRDDVKQ